MLEERIARAAEIKGISNVEVIPELAEMNRQATGWLKIVIQGLLGLVIGLAWLGVEIVLLAFLLERVLRMALDFALTIGDPTQDIIGPVASKAMVAILRGANFSEIGELPLQGEGWHWAALLAGALLMLYLSEGVRDFLRGVTIWPSDNKPHWAIALPLQAVYGIALAGLVMFIGGLAALALMPLVRFGVFVGVIFDFIKMNWESLQPLVETYWYYGAGVVVLLALVIYRSRKSLSTRPLKILVVLMSLVGLGLMGVHTNLLFGNTLVYWGLIALMLLYPLRLAVPLAKILLPPFNTFRNTYFWAYQSTRLRIRLRQALRFHRQRNREKTQGRIWATVCQQDLVRFSEHTERLAYGGWLTYGYCPVCKSDKKAYNGVNCLALSVDAGMGEKISQKGAVLWLNGSEWLNGPENAAVPVFDAIVVGKADKHMVEGLVVRYNSQKLTERHRPLKEIPVYLGKDTELEQNTLRILEENCGKVARGDAPAGALQPIPANLERRDYLHKQTQRFWRAFQRVGCAVLVMLLVLGGVAALYYLVPDVRDKILDMVSDLRSFWGEVQFFWNSIQD
ncbi:MAG: hypothetical protein MUC85_01965 [Anaerolineales bacterium]|nr:hypothetical protein [Anaerolineales bacterium]